jgi:hypothetical protein
MATAMSEKVIGCDGSAVPGCNCIRP